MDDHTNAYITAASNPRQKSPDWVGMVYTVILNENTKEERFWKK